MNTDFLTEKIGGVGESVQIDETAICNGKIITDPSNELDDVPGIQWIVGGVQSNDSRKFFIKLVPNRKKETILSVLNDHVIVGTEIITDGYPSYPWAVEKFGSSHEVVNHTEGFVNSNGYHTNRIENFWSHPKQDYRARGGVNKSRMKWFLIDFSFRKRVISSTMSGTRNDALLILLTLLNVIH